MDAEQRNRLQIKRSCLVKDLEPSKLYDGLLARGVFTQDMIEEIQCAGTRREQARKLLIDLETRGKRAFPAFLECLREAGQEDLAIILQNGTSSHCPPPVTIPAPVYMPSDARNHDRGDGEVMKVPPMTSVIPAQNPEDSRLTNIKQDPLQSYKIDASPCGLCLIINNVKFLPESGLKNRSGSNIDCDKLEKRFKSLNFIVDVQQNLKNKQIRQHLSALSKKDHSNYDCCIVVILSHGTEASHNRFPGAVHGVDGPAVLVESITNFLNGEQCPSLQGKPKLFFIQACGGDKRDTGFEVSPEEAGPSLGGLDEEMDAIPTSSSSDSVSASDEIDARTTLPVPSDILVSYSTYPGYVSWRDKEKGSCYVETLDQILAEHAATRDLVTMLTMVNNKVSQNSAKGIYKQMPGSFNFLRKLLYFQSSSQVHS
ncbi:caspase-9-like [Brienomyrus brachyistius]|uniref:caspase-9-like n=1 Tax=Brienomyrus brachyistius TaxID=42636 RepID=UPI0020B2FB92|nr:caspase-9-like [Brienomyrus brachyistius]